MDEWWKFSDSGGLDFGQYDTPSYGGADNNYGYDYDYSWAQKDAPDYGGADNNYGYDYDYSWSQNTTPTTTGAGLPTGGPSFTATTGTGSGATGVGGAGDSAAAQNVVASTPSNAGVTGDFGGAGLSRNPYDTQRGKPAPGLLEQAGGWWNTAKDVGKEALTWARDPANRDLVRLGIQGAGALAGYQNNRAAQQNMQQQVQMQQRAMQTQEAAQRKNQAVADKVNAQAAQSMQEARSLYNPQEMGIRRMADARATTGRAVNDLRSSMGRRGASQNAIDAEARRTRLQGAANEVSAFTGGYDAGRQGQQAALTNAAGMFKNYSGLNFAPSTAVAEYYTKAGDANAKNLRALLESYTNYPTLSAAEEKRRQLQRESTQ